MKLVVTLLMVPLLLSPLPLTAQQMTLPEAIVAQQELIEENPADATLLNDLGNLLLLVDRSTEAEEAYLGAIELDPELASARFNLALLMHQTQRPAKARRELGRVLDIEPTHAWAHYQLGVLNAERGRRSMAIRNYARALRLEPRLTDPAYNPHIVDNQFAASAILKAYADLTSVDLVPRTYQEPRRIAGLFIPMLPAPPVATETGELTEAPSPESSGRSPDEGVTPEGAASSPAEPRAPDGR
jgi:tetratricopeptide (TPR) repeat protein